MGLQNLMIQQLIISWSMSPPAHKLVFIKFTLGQFQGKEFQNFQYTLQQVFKKSMVNVKSFHIILAHQIVLLIDCHWVQWLDPPNLLLHDSSNCVLMDSLSHTRKLINLVINRVIKYCRRQLLKMSFHVILLPSSNENEITWMLVVLFS